MGSPSCATARRPRRPRLGRCAGTACVRSRPDALCQFVGGWSAGAAQPRTKFTSGAVARAIGPEAWEGPPEHLGSGVVGKLRAGHLVVLALDRRQCPCSPRKRRGRRGDRRPSLRTQTLRRLGAARLVFGGCPITGAQSSRHAPCAAATVRRRRAQLTSRDSSRQARANPCGRRRAAQVDGRRGRSRHNRPWAGSSARR